MGMVTKGMEQKHNRQEMKTMETGQDSGIHRDESNSPHPHCSTASRRSRTFSRCSLGAIEQAVLRGDLSNSGKSTTPSFPNGFTSRAEASSSPHSLPLAADTGTYRSPIPLHQMLSHNFPPQDSRSPTLRLRVPTHRTPSV